MTDNKIIMNSGSEQLNNLDDTRIKLLLKDCKLELEDVKTITRQKFSSRQVSVFLEYAIENSKTDIIKYLLKILYLEEEFLNKELIRKAIKKKLDKSIIKLLFKNIDEKNKNEILLEVIDNKNLYMELNKIHNIDFTIINKFQKEQIELLNEDQLLKENINKKIDDHKIDYLKKYINFSSKRLNKNFKLLILDVLNKERYDDCLKGDIYILNELLYHTNDLYKQHKRLKDYADNPYQRKKQTINIKLIEDQDLEFIKNYLENRKKLNKIKLYFEMTYDECLIAINEIIKRLKYYYLLSLLY